MEHKNFHEAYGIKADPPVKKEELQPYVHKPLPDPLEMDCDVDDLPAEVEFVPPTAQGVLGSNDPESEAYEDINEEQLLKVLKL